MRERLGAILERLLIAKLFFTEKCRAAPGASWLSVDWQALLANLRRPSHSTTLGVQHILRFF